METVQDVYTVGDLSENMERWRPFVDLRPESEWTPQKHNTVLVDAHRRQGLVVYEHALILSSIEDDPHRTWHVKDLYRTFKLISEIELRVIEIELCSFQLTANTVGINMAVPHEDLYHATTVAFMAHLYLWDLACEAAEKKEGRKEVLADAPSRTDSRRKLASNLDKQIFAVNVLTRKALPKIQGRMDADRSRELASRLGTLVSWLDRVVVVLP